MAAGTYTVSQLTTDDPVLSNLRVGGKYYKCTAAGTTSFFSTKAYGDWEFSVLKATPATGDLRIDIIGLCPITPGVIDDGYFLLYTDSGRLDFHRMTNGFGHPLFATAASYLSLVTPTWYSIKVKRRSGGVFTMYVRGGVFGDSYIKASLVGSIVGSNPITDNNHTSSSIMELDFDVGDGFMWTPDERVTSVNAGLFGANPFIPPIPKTNGAVSITV